MKELRSNILIAFSGGCFSGKTTTMNKLLLYLSNKGYPVEVIRERAREFMPLHYGGNIDVLRKNVKDYLKFEIDIISKKIQDEEDALNGKSKKIYLIDRALSDSLFYLETYIDIRSLDLESAKEFTDFHEKLINKMIKLMHSRRYDMVFEFKPIEHVANEDTFRPENIGEIKYYEHNRIKQINNNYIAGKTLLYRPDCMSKNNLFKYVRKNVEYFMDFYKKNISYGTEI